MNFSGVVLCGLVGGLLLLPVAHDACAHTQHGRTTHARTGHRNTALCLSRGSVIKTRGHALHSIGDKRYFAPVGQAMYYTDKSRSCLMRAKRRHRS
jgi:hypothetical protein